MILAYGLAGGDCIDVAADAAVVAVARSAQEVIVSLAAEARRRGFRPQRPWLMVSLNDGDDPHFRKAVFDPARCPSDCPRPCEAVCPAEAITFQGDRPGVISERCYGCGRCLTLCPWNYITAQSHHASPEAIASLLADEADAVEIHTQVEHYSHFHRLWHRAILPYADRLKLIAVSCPDGEGVVEYLRTLHQLMSPLPCALLWQVDGRPMSGDLGIGTTHATLRLARKVADADLPGYIQLAGGTNHHTVSALRRLQAEQHVAGQTPLPVAGIAYGSYARAQFRPLLEQLGSARLEDHPDLLWQAVAIAHNLVSQVKDASAMLTASIEQSSTLEAYPARVTR